MALDNTSSRDREVVHQCLVALRAGEFIDEDEFQSRIGLSVTEYDAVVSAWPAIDDRADDSDACLAINNALNELSYGMRVEPDMWSSQIDASADEVREVYRHWAVARGWRQTGIR